MLLPNSIVHDYLGISFSAKKYNRIISLVPSLTDLLFSFGLEHSIVGVTKYCNYPPHARNKPRLIVGGTKNPDFKKIIDLKPDIVLVNEEENQLKHYSKFLELRIPVFVTFPKSVDEALKLFNDLQTLFCIPFLSELSKLEQLVNDINQKVSKIPITERKKIFCPIWKNPWMTFNANTYASSIIDVCGGINVFRDETERYPKITLENIIDKVPDIIVLPDEPYHFKDGDKEELLKTFSQFKIEIELISGTFHWYSISKMMDALLTLRTLLDKK